MADVVGNPYTRSRPWFPVHDFTGGTCYHRKNPESGSTVEYGPSTADPAFIGKQVTVSQENFPFTPKGMREGYGPGGRHFQPMENSGGPFETSKSEVLSVPASVYVPWYKKSQGNEYQFNGNVYISHLVDKGGIFPLSQSSSDEELDEAGTKAIASCSPTSSVVELGAGLRELHQEGLPSLPGVKTWEQRAKLLLAAGDEFLNYEFGWKPLTEEVSSVSNSISHASSVLRQFRADAGKQVRRQFYFPIENSESNQTLTPSVAATTGINENSALYGGPEAKCNKQIQIRRKQWFSGCFTYYLPTDNSVWGRLEGYGDQAQKILGVNPLTPSALWEVAPWSWAVDWFSDASEFISNLETFDLDGLVMRYGYIMEETMVTCVYTLENGSGFTKIAPQQVAPLITRTVTKKRRLANPFGFGLDWEGLSPLQLAIAAALGITRLL